MAPKLRRNIPKESVNALENAPLPSQGILLQARAGKLKKAALGGEITSAIFKKEIDGPVFCSSTGLVGDEHAAKDHGGTERAVHQYNPCNYADWREDNPPHPDLYDYGGFGENILTTNLTEENVCIGDLYTLGENVILEVSEPRHPCYKLNARFQWPRALKRTIQSGRSGWNYRVLQEGMISKGDKINLIKRPYPQWSVLNFQRVLRGRDVPLPLIAELTNLPTTKLWTTIANERLEGAVKRYVLVEAKMVATRVRKLTFKLKEPLPFNDPEFKPYAYAVIDFGPKENRFSRSYSIVDGDLHSFSLGISLDRNSRGGSAYLHNSLKVGDEIDMAPGDNPQALEDEKSCDEKTPRILFAGGIGITAFMPAIRYWEKKGLPWRLHYSARTPEDAAFRNELPGDKTSFHFSSQGQRINLSDLIPKPNLKDESASFRIFVCGPPGLMKEAQRLTSELGYPKHMTHFEDFGGGTGGDLGPAFDVDVNDPDGDRQEKLTVPSNKTLLDVLTEAGFDVTYSCKHGACGACKVLLCKGKVDYKSTALLANQKGSALQACVDRGQGDIAIEIE